MENPHSTHSAPPVQRAVLFADISGSTRLYEVLGDKQAFSAINACLKRLSEVAEEHGGRVVKTIGDEILVVFPGAAEAIHAACEMQLAVSTLAPTGPARMAIRVGFHAGEVIERDGDVFGDTVNVAARMASLAKAEQILTTGEVVAGLPPLMQTATRPLDALAIKGKGAAIEVCEVIWLESDDMTMMVGGGTFAERPEPRLRLVHQGQVVMVDARRSTVTLGRDEHADIVIQDRRASRLHAVIERRRDKFVFVDKSSNGSYLTVRGEQELQLRREEFVLRESGSISLGHAYLKDPTEVVEFECLS